MNDFLFQMVKSLHVITKGVLPYKDEFFEQVLQLMDEFFEWVLQLKDDFFE